MSRVVELLCSRRTPQVAVLALMSFGFAGCSADMQTRLSQNSFSNPFSSQPETTGSVAAPTPQVERRELPQYARPQPQYQSSALPPPIAAPQTYPAARRVRRRARALRPIRRRRRQPIETTGSVAPRSIAATRAPGREAGTTIIVGTSDTLEALSHRYGVSTAEILQANGYKGPRALAARPAADHSAARGRCGAGRGCTEGRRGRCAGAAPVARAAERACRQSRRHADEHRAPQSRAGRRTGQGQRHRCQFQIEARPEDQRARREIGRGTGRRATGASRCRPARRGGGACDQDGRG